MADAAKLAAVLDSPFGRALHERLRRAHYAALYNASHNNDNGVSMHFARGFEDCIMFIFEKLSVRSYGVEQTDTGAPGVAPTSETAEQRNEREMRELVERLSP